jgi:hypothetical protein
MDKLQTQINSFRLYLLVIIAVCCPTIIVPAQAGMMSFISPSPGQTFAPGDVIPVIVNIDLAANPNITPGRVLVDSGPWVLLNPAGLKWTTPPYSASLTIPESFSGTMTLTGMVIDATDYDKNEYASVVLKVVPVGSPVALYATNRPFRLDHPAAPADSVNLKVMGRFANGHRYNMDYQDSGMMYQSLHPEVATVDAAGVVTAVGIGDNLIRLYNGSVESWARITVRDPTSPGTLPAPIDNTAHVSIVSGEFWPIPNTSNHVAHEITITNTSEIRLFTPLILVLEGLPPSLIVLDASKTENIAPLESSVYTFPQSAGAWYSPGESSTVEIRFMNPQGVPVTYTPKVYTAYSP